jgi:GINS complex subunit 3
MRHLFCCLRHAVAARSPLLVWQAWSSLQHVEEGARLELPLWMAERLAAGQFVGVELPRNFSGSVRDALLAAPKSARLRERSPFFYEAGLRLAGLSHLEEARSLPAAIQATLATRVHMILLRAQHSSERVQASDFLEPLTDLEQRLFWGGYRHQRDLLAWRGLHTWEIRAGALRRSATAAA